MAAVLSSSSVRGSDVGRFLAVETVVAWKKGLRRRKLRPSRSHQEKMLAKFESVSGCQSEWCTRCMFGETITSRSQRSHASGRATLLWWKPMTGSNAV